MRIGAPALSALACLMGASDLAAAQPTPPCVPVQPGRPRALFERVPVLSSAQMTATRDGGAVIAFSTYRSFKGFPAGRVSVVAVDSAGCVHWRALLRGMQPNARPAEVGARAIVVASRTPRGSLRIDTLGASTGRVLRIDVLPSIPVSGTAPILLTDRRGDIAIVVATLVPAGSPGRLRPVTLKLTRRTHARHWSRQVIARSNTQPAAAMARPNGDLVVGYPRAGRLWVRTGTVAGRLGAPTEAGPIAGNFKPGVVALGQDGTVAAVWQSGTYSRPWRLRAAVRPAGAKRFARFAQLGFGGKGYLGEVSPAVRVSPDGRATVGFFAPNVDGAVMCAYATPGGGFAAVRQVVAGDPWHRGPWGGSLPATVFGPDALGATIAATGTAAEVVAVDTRCGVHGTRPLDPGAGVPEQAMIDARSRVWVLGHDRYGASISARRTLLLTIATFDQRS